MASPRTLDRAHLSPLSPDPDDPVARDSVVLGAAECAAGAPRGEHRLPQARPPAGRAFPSGMSFAYIERVMCARPLGLALALLDRTR